MLFLTTKRYSIFLSFFLFFLIACQPPSELPPRSTPVQPVFKPPVFNPLVFKRSVPDLPLLEPREIEPSSLLPTPQQLEQRKQAEILADRIVVQKQAIGERKETFLSPPQSADSKDSSVSDQKKTEISVKNSSRDSQAMYNAALSLLLNGKVLAARKKFISFQEVWPKSELMPNVLYWLGETYYVQSQFSVAVLTFKKVWEKYPKHAKAPDAMLKAGYSYLGLKNVETAKLYLRTVVQDYPRSNSALLAQKKLETL